MIDLIYSCGNNAPYSEIALRHGWLLGIRSDLWVMAGPIQFVDIDYKHPDFAAHVDVVKQLRPKYAIVPDLSETYVGRDDIKRCLKQYEMLLYHAETVFVVPKLSGQLSYIPAYIPVAYSVPTSYGGARYHLRELEGRDVHLLGGSPHTQVQCYLHLLSIARVVSADGNMHQKMSGFAKYWHGNRWIRHERTGEGVTLECIERSLYNIYQHWQEIFLSVRRTKRTLVV